MKPTEADLVALTELALQTKWLKDLPTQDLRNSIGAGALYYDNSSTVTLENDPISSDRTKYIDVQQQRFKRLLIPRSLESCGYPQTGR
jgi:hypothetical protein